MSGSEPSTALNGICPYYTMFPLDFPSSTLSREAKPGEWVIDPFCGRGTTNYASRVLGLRSVGIDSSPVAAAIAAAKLANTTPKAIVRAAEHILSQVSDAREIPKGEFWELAYDSDVLKTLCRLREGLMGNCRSESRKALRALILGALHGPRGKTVSSYFSNQCPRTYGPKPRYAVSFWTKNGFSPPGVDVLDIVRKRAERYYGGELTTGVGKIICGDSRRRSTFTSASMPKDISWVVTSPPFYGMRTYLPDQWLRLWFLGGPAYVHYSSENQLSHSSPDAFTNELRQVWLNLATVCLPSAKMVIRFGGINERKADSRSLMLNSLKDSGWKVMEIVNAGSATNGRRQAISMATGNSTPLEEFDVSAVREI